VPDVKDGHWNVRLAEDLQYLTAVKKGYSSGSVYSNDDGFE
jgi:hypothetical protein